MGTITSGGVFTAPQIMPATGLVTVAATSVASTSASGSAIVTIADGFTLAISGPTSLTAGMAGAYSASLAVAANANPSAAIGWSVTGVSCGACGTFVTSGANATYTAPATPTQITVTIIATPAADRAKAASLNVTINPPAGVMVVVTPANVTVVVNTTQNFNAQVTGRYEHRGDMGCEWDRWRELNGGTGDEQRGQRHHYLHCASGGAKSGKRGNSCDEQRERSRCGQRKRNDQYGRGYESKRAGNLAAATRECVCGVGWQLQFGSEWK